MQQTASGPVARRMVVCYMESWSAYRAPPLAFTAGLVPNACTHLHYAFAGIHPHTYTVVPSNEDYDIVKGNFILSRYLMPPALYTAKDQSSLCGRLYF